MTHTESLDSLHSWVLFQPFGMLPAGLVPGLVCVRAKGDFITFALALNNLRGGTSQGGMF